MATIQKRMEYRRGFSRVLSQLEFTQMSRDIVRKDTMTKEEFKRYGKVIKNAYRKSRLSTEQKNRGIRGVNNIIDKY